MFKTYCSVCGHCNEYSLKQPKFCGSCGKNIGANLGSSVPVAKPKIARVVIEEDEDTVYEQQDVEYKASITYDVTPIAPAQNIESVLKQKPLNIGTRDPDPVFSGKNSEQTMEIIKQQASSKRSVEIE